MEFTIEKQEEKPLVERLEVILKARDFEATPSNAQVQEAVAKQLNKPSELIVIKRIHQKFGKSEAQAFIYVYKSKEALNKFEPKPKKKKGKPGEKPEKEEAEAAPEAVPTEAAAPTEKPEKPVEKPVKKTEEAKTEEKKE